jgi:hypothetical protein
MSEEKNMYQYDNWVEAPHSAEVATGIRQIAMAAGLDVTINTETSGWVFKKDTVFFKVISSDFSKVERFRQAMIEIMTNITQGGPGISGYGSNVSGYGIPRDDNDFHSGYGIN